jgi:hypothetical protein
MVGIIKPLGVSRSCNTQSNTYGNNVLVFLTHSANPTSEHLVTCKYANGSVKYTIAIVGGTQLVLEKGATDTLESADTGTSVDAVAIAYKS